ncbi:MAG: hypothetical protein PHP45_05125 [Elusimicrobiales bacterium]|nr:hypothetical protein [Elusimicrobiales bacterium]
MKKIKRFVRPRKENDKGNKSGPCKLSVYSIVQTHADINISEEQKPARLVSQLFPEKYAAYPQKYGLAIHYQSMAAVNFAMRSMPVVKIAAKRNRSV